MMLGDFVQRQEWAHEHTGRPVQVDPVLAALGFGACI